MLFSVLYGFFVANVMAFNGDVPRDIAAHTLELAEKQSASFPRVFGHNNLGGSLMQRGDFAEARIHFDQAIALYDPALHRPLAARFGEDQTVATLAMRSRAFLSDLLKPLEIVEVVALPYQSSDIIRSSWRQQGWRSKGR